MQKSSDRFRLDPALVRYTVSEEELAGIRPSYIHHRIIGQPRAVEALNLALAIPAKGYNVFVAGQAGTGKRTAVMRILKDQPFDPHQLRDIAYVNNFHQPDRPRVLSFSPGDALRFRRKVHDLVETLKERLPTVLEKSGFREERDHIMLETEEHEASALQSFENDLSREGFTIVQIQEEQEQRSDISPVIEGTPVPMEDLQKQVARGALDPARAESLRRRYYQLMDQMNQIFLSLRGERLVAEKKLRTLQRETIQPLLDRLVSEVTDVFQGEKIHRHLEELKEDILENLELFIPQDLSRDQEIQQELQRYNINIVLDHSNTRQKPVIFESHPDYQKLFGSQDSLPDSDGTQGFLTLRGGSLIAASGGYLVLRAEDVLSHDEIWASLKRALQDGITEIRTPPSPFGGPQQNLKPEPIELDLKVILMGSEQVYEILFHQDEEFGKLFKVLSEFDSVMANSAETRTAYLDFMEMICEEERLLPLDPGGKAAIVEYGVRLSEFRDKLSTRFSLIADLIRESNHWARLDQADTIGRGAVEKARDMRRFLHNLPEEKFDEQLSSGEMILQVTGHRIGAINGLSVLDRGYYAFGRPMLITARVAPGSDGIINIERESGLSGEIHDKGIYIIQGFLQATYATTFPLSINASIGFEQSYVEVDGDSASSTEIYVLLSAIGDIPLRQDIAVTGSVNQFGQIQPVGGISEKIEGFFATCRLMGLTGDQGVLIPRTNIQNLILSREVQEAITRGGFHIYAIDTVDEGIEILTGLPAGARGNDGHFPKQTVNGRVERRLRQMAEQVKDFS